MQSLKTILIAAFVLLCMAASTHALRCYVSETDTVYTVQNSTAYINCFRAIKDGVRAFGGSSVSCNQTTAAVVQIGGTMETCCNMDLCNGANGVVGGGMVVIAMSVLVSLLIMF